jgi:hypothetical protein
MSRTGDKKEEDKYCQENFDLSNKDNRNGLITTVVLFSVLIFGIAIVVYSLRKAENIRKTAKTLFPELNCNNINLVEAKSILPENVTRCTCYYGKNAAIRGCTNHDNFLVKNDFYDSHVVKPLVIQ